MLKRKSIGFPRPRMREGISYLLFLALIMLQLVERSSGLTAKNAPDFDVIIIGGGITGLATAAMLLHKGKEDGDCEYPIHPSQICIFEQSKSIQPVGATIGLFPNGATALDSISSQLANKVCDSGLTYQGVIRHNLTSGEGEVTKVNSSNFHNIGRGTYVVAWYILQQSLHDMIPPGVLRFGKVVESLSLDNKSEDDEDPFITVSYRNRLTNTLEQSTCRIVVGADGINSIIRDILFPEYKLVFNDKHDLNRKLFRAIIRKEKLLENVKDAENIKNIVPPPGFTNIYSCGKSDRVFAMRQVADDVYSFTSSVNGTVGQDINMTSSGDKLYRLFDYFKDFPSPVQHWIQAVDKDAIYENDVYDIDMLKKWSRSNCVLIGDSCHGMSPSLGQGANVGLEDAVELGTLLRPLLRSYRNGKTNEGKRPTIKKTTIQTELEKFEQLRIERVGKIHEASRGRRNGNGMDPSFRSWLYSWQPSFMSEKK